jgi:hypothetical protein
VRVNNRCPAIAVFLLAELYFFNGANARASCEFLRGAFGVRGDAC